MYHDVPALEIDSSGLQRCTNAQHSMAIAKHPYWLAVNASLEHALVERLSLLSDGTGLHSVRETLKAM